MDLKKKKRYLLLPLKKAEGWPPPSPVCSLNAPSFTECTNWSFKQVWFKPTHFLNFVQATNLETEGPSILSAFSPFSDMV